MIQAKQVEPPSWLRLPLFMLGQDLRGNWVVQEQRGARGGLFVDREAALRFIRAETARKQQAIAMVSGIFGASTLAVKATRLRQAMSPPMLHLCAESPK